MNFFDAGPFILRLLLVAHCEVRSLDISSLLRIAKLNIFDPDTPFLGLTLESLTYVFWAVVAVDKLLLTAPGNDLLQ